MREELREGEKWQKKDCKWLGVKNYFDKVFFNNKKKKQSRLFEIP